MKQCPKCDYPNPDSRSTCFKCAASLDAQADPAAASQAPPSQAADACAKCGAHAEEGHPTPLCAHCRTSLARAELPKWVWASILFVLLVVCYAITQFPSTLNADIAFERGRRAEAAGDYARAVTQYRIAADRFPDSTEVIARLGISLYHAGNIGEAVTYLSSLEGREASDQLISEVNSVVEEIKKKADAIQPQGRGN